MTAAAAPFDFAAEADWGRCGALKDHWYVACLSSELPAGVALSRTIFGIPLVLFRGADGRVAALRDRCLHRNAPLSAGAVFDGKLGCPYHGWVYDQTGSCVEIPSLGPSQRGTSLCVSPDRAGRVQTWPTVEQDGLVFVLPGLDTLRARRPPFRTPHWGESDWCVYYMVTRFPNGVTNLAENFMDVPHTVFVHRKWFRNRKRREVPTHIERRDESVLVTYQQAQDRIAGVGRLFNPGDAPMLHTDKFFAPNVTRVDYGFGARSGVVITSQTTPVSAFDTWVYTAISYRLPADLPGAVGARLLRPLLRWYTTKVIVQDVDIMGLQKQGITSSSDGAAFVSTDADLLHGYIEDYRRWLLAGAVPGARPPDESRTISFWI